MIDPAAMTIDDAMRELAGTGLRWQDARRWAVANWPVAAPRLLENLSRCAGGADRSGQTLSVLAPIIDLCRDQAETAAFQSLCRLLRDREAMATVAGDDFMLHLHDALIRTFDGDAAALRAVVEDAEADQFVRHAAMLAVASLTSTGGIAQADTRAWLAGLLTTMQPQGECYVWVGVAECVVVLGFADLAPQVEQLFTRGFIDPSDLDYADFAADLKRTLDGSEIAVQASEPEPAPLFGSLQEVARDVAAVTEPVRRDAGRASRRPRALPRQEQLSLSGDRNPWRNVGRNDPCPCGSGKKFKKCCLGKPETERHAAEAARAA